MSSCKYCGGDLSDRLLSIIELFAGAGSGGELATKCDLKEWKEEVMLKLSELKGEISGVKGQVTKIWNEQQAKYDALFVSYTELQAALANVEVPADVVQDIADFKAELKAFDDTIPDTTA